MKFDDLQGKISALISEYNKGLDQHSDDRVTTAQLHLARSDEMCTQEQPGLVFVTPAEFAVSSPDAGEEPRSLSAAASGAASGAQCCAVGWKGVVFNGVFVNCFPTPGMCGNFSGPNKCNIPGS